VPLEPAVSTVVLTKPAGVPADAAVIEVFVATDPDGVPADIKPTDTLVDTEPLGVPADSDDIDVPTEIPVVADGTVTPEGAVPSLPFTNLAVPISPFAILVTL
jgi:hypothetical protein